VPASASITHGLIPGDMEAIMAGVVMAATEVGAGTTLGDGTVGAAGAATTEVGAMLVIMVDGDGIIGAGEAITPGALHTHMAMVTIQDMP